MTTNQAKSLGQAKNIGPIILQRLHEIGVYSLADLAKTTSPCAYVQICAQHPTKTFPVCYYLYSLEGALLDLHWDELPKNLKEDLLKKARRLAGT